jgi:nitrate/nitrite transporter NarK
MMVGCLMVASSGLHVQMPVADSISIRLARKGRGATRMGQVGAIAAAGYIAGCGAVWVARRLGADYYDLFLMAIVVGLVSCVVYALMHPGSADPAQARPRLVVRRQYRLYYVLSTLFGARKQVFLTFAPFVLIRIYHQPVETFAKLGMVAALIGLFFRPALGRLIDRLGERSILMADAVVSLVITFSYGFADQWGLGGLTIYVLYACWIVDSVTFAVGMARTTYLNRIVVERSDLTPTLSLGITINHAVSMIVPTIGGMVWDSPGLGYRIVFLGAALVAASTLAAASAMPRGGRDGGEVSEAPPEKQALGEQAEIEHD